MQNDTVATPVSPTAAGTLLVERSVHKKVLESRTAAAVYEAPRRPWFFPLGYLNGAEKTPLPAGTTVQVTRVGETYMGLRQFVWLHVTTTRAPETSGWHPLGGQHRALGTLQETWDEVTDEEGVPRATAREPPEPMPGVEMAQTIERAADREIGVPKRN